MRPSLASAEAGESSEPVRNRRGWWLLLLFEVASAEPVRLSACPPRTTPTPDSATVELTASLVLVGPPPVALLVTTPVTGLEVGVLTSLVMDFPPFSLSFFLEDDLRTSRRSLSLSDKRRRKRTSDWAEVGDDWYGPKKIWKSNYYIFAF